MVTRLEKCSSVYGSVSAVASKSDAHRALICAALCNGETEITVKELNDDITATAGCLKALGAEIKRTENGFFVVGRARGGGELQCGESGSTARFLLPICAALGKGAALSGKGKLPTRPMLPLSEELRRNGCNVSSDFLPLTVSGKLKGGRYVLSGNVSSQFISGLLMALPITNAPSEIMLSSPLQSELYADMTVRTLSEFGVSWKKLSPEQTEGFCGGYRLEGDVDYGYVCSAVGEKRNYNTYKTCGKYEVEGDWSGAAFFAVTAAIAGEITLSGLKSDSLQPDKAIIDIIGTAGASVCENGDGICVSKGKIAPISVDVSQFPDLFPVLATLACAANGESLLYNAGRLRIKESDRITATANMITSLGGSVEEGDDYLKIFGKGYLDGGSVDCAGDHRIAMSAAVASLICKNGAELSGSEAVKKSYPDFFAVFDKVRCKRG